MAKAKRKTRADKAVELQDPDPLLTRTPPKATDTFVIPEGALEFTYPRVVSPESRALLVDWFALVSRKLDAFTNVCTEVGCGSPRTLWECFGERGWCEGHAPGKRIAKW